MRTIEEEDIIPDSLKIGNKSLLLLTFIIILVSGFSLIMIFL